MSDSQEQTLRLQKIIANHFKISRRQAEAWIAERVVTVNGKIAQLGDKANPYEDAIKVRNKLLAKAKYNQEEKIVLALNKPKGYICSHSDPFHVKTIYNLVPIKYRKYKLMSAGRLDKNSQGLIILTNDGQLIHKLTHPSEEVIKRYLVTLSKPFDKKMIPKLLKGKKIEGERLFFHKVISLKDIPKAEYKIEVHLAQGRKREIRRLLKAFGYFVDKLKRFQIGSFSLKGISSGEVKVLSEEEIKKILKN